MKIMNKNIAISLLAAGVTLALASCGENTWNDKFLDGFEGDVDYNKPSKVEGEYTLTQADYKTISKALLEVAVTDEEKAAAKAIETNCCFDKNSIYPAPVAIPRLLATASFPYYLDAVGSNAAVTYDEADAIPRELASLSKAYTYKISDSEYQQVWDSETDYVASFAPSHTPAAELPSLLKAGIPDAVEGDYAVVNYNVAQIDPVFGSTPDEPKFEPSSILGSITSMTSGDEITYAGVVMATSSQGPVIADASGALFTYLPTNNADLKIGDQVEVTGNLGTHNYAWQLDKGATANVKGSQAVSYPAPRTWTGAEIDAFFASAMASGAGYITPIYSRITGTVKAGSYINIIIDGTTVQASPYGATDAVKAAFVDGATVTIEGYFMAIASMGKYMNIIITKIGDKNISTLAAPKASRAVNITSASENSVYYFNGTKWSVADAVSVLNPGDYTAMGFENNKLSDPDVYLPTYLKSTLPYAQSGDTQYVVYNGNKAALYAFDGNLWTRNDNYRETVTARYTRKATGWSFVKYLGKAVFNIFIDNQIALDHSYLLVVGDQCATPISESKSYGYLTAVTVPVDNGVIVLSADNYAISFLSAYVNEDEGISVKCPEGTFLMRDCYNRYFYMSGAYNSPNLSSSPLKDGSIDEQYLWTATKNDDNTWDIVRGDRTVCLSTNYGSYGAYQPSGISEFEKKPSLYILD